jgi:hypothetical protein
VTTVSPVASVVNENQATIATTLTQVQSIESPNWIQFNTTAVASTGVGRLWWNDTDGTLDLGMKGGQVTQQIGQEQYVRAKNADNAGLTEGLVYYISGATGGVKQVKLAQANSVTTTKPTIGVATETIDGGGQGFLTTFGLVRKLPNSLFTNVTEGSPVYLSATTPGAFTSTPPAAPNHRVQVGFCVRKQSNNNELFVKVQTGLDLTELCDVEITDPQEGDVLVYRSGVWVNEASA